MALLGRSIVSIDDLSDEEIEEIFHKADIIAEKGIRHFASLAQGRVLATLFFEPSTRTRLSFEAAMARLGGQSISAWDTSTTSLAKGESLADTIRVVSKYADAIVLRHPWDGSAQLAARYAEVPVINAGDGGHEHPTQTLCDLYTLRQHRKSLRGLKVALCGDLEKGRTIHSLAFGLIRFGAQVVFVPGNGKQVPEYVLGRLQRDYGAQIKHGKDGVLSALFGTPAEDAKDNEVDVIYMTPTPHQSAQQPPLLTEEGTKLIDSETQIEITISGRMALYVTRIQKERSTTEEQGEQEGEYPKVTKEVLRRPEFRRVSVLHPLPRLDEVSPEVDKDRRSSYFEQAGYGIPIRMALLLKILGLRSPDEDEPEHVLYRRFAKGEVTERQGHIRCVNPNCVSNREPNFALPCYEIVDGDVLTLRCLYCDFQVEPRFFGVLTSHKYYPIRAFHRLRPSLGNVIFFTNPPIAQEAGFTKGHVQLSARKTKNLDTVDAVHR